MSIGRCPERGARARAGVLAIALVTALVAGVPAGAQTTTGLENLEQQVEEFTLSNGLKFIVVERREAPVFSFMLMVDAGSAQDELGTTGIAHMMEHMAFKGTERVGTTDADAEKRALQKEEELWLQVHAARQKGERGDPEQLAQLEEAFEAAIEEARSYVVGNEFSSILESNGAQGLNAFTAPDFTGYLYSMPSNRLELWALMEGSRMAFPVFREFYTERDVVYEERRMRVESSPIGRLINRFLHIAYDAHPYGIGGIGFPSDLKSFSRTEGEEFYRKYYVASNMTVAIVGDVDTKDVQKYAEKYMSDIPAGPKPLDLDTVEPEQIAEKRVIMEDPSQPIVIIAWHCPAVTDPTYPAYEALASMLGGGNYSRLYKKLVKEDKTAVQVQSLVGLPGNKYPSLFGVFVVPATGQDPMEVEQSVYDVIADVQGENPFTQEELDGFKVRTRAQLIGASESNSDLANQLAINQTLLGDWRQFFRGLERVQGLTVEDVHAVMETTIQRKNRVVGMIVPPEETDGEEGGAE